MKTKFIQATCWCGNTVVYKSWCRDHAPRCSSGNHFYGNCRCVGKQVLDAKEKGGFKTSFNRDTICLGCRTNGGLFLIEDFTYTLSKDILYFRCKNCTIDIYEVPNAE